MSCSKAKEVVWNVATCADRQNPPDLVPWGRWRDTVNVILDSEQALARGGWTRLGAEFESVENPDLHGTPVTTLYSWSREWGGRILLAGSQSGVHRWSPASGVWTALSGVPVLESGERRSFAALGKYCIFAGGLGGATAEGVRAYDVDLGTVSAIPSLTDIALTSANHVIEWRGVVFLLDVVMGGVRVGHRAVWSGRNDPLRYAPSDDSVAGQYDLDPGEIILGAAISGDSLYILTDRSIWRVVATGDDEVFRFQQVYRSDSGHRCLWAPYTLDVLPDGNLIYLGDNGRIYVYSPYQPAPEEPEWISVATPGVKLRLPACRLFFGRVCDNGATVEYLLSFPTSSGDDAPTQTYAIDFERTCVTRIDHGFWCAHTWYSFVSECPRPTQLILSSAGDDSLKEARFFDIFTRERWDPGTSTWVRDQFDTQYLTGALGFDLTGSDKQMTKLDIHAQVPAGLDPGEVQLYVGHSNYPTDPSAYFTNCPIAWYALSSRDVPCGLAANVPLPWRFVVRGRFLYFKVVIRGPCVLSRITASVEVV